MKGTRARCRAAAQSLGHGFIASSMGTMRARASVRSTKLEVNSVAVAVSDRPAAGTSTAVAALVWPARQARPGCGGSPPATTRRCSSTQQTSALGKRARKVAMDAHNSCGVYREKVE